MNLTLADLYRLYKNTGINGSPVIKDNELLQLKGKLRELHEFLELNNLVNLNIWSKIEEIDGILEARARHEMEEKIKSELNVTHVSM